MNARFGDNSESGDTVELIVDDKMVGWLFQEDKELIRDRLNEPHVWVVIDRDRFWGVFGSREAACDAYTQTMERRGIKGIGWQARGSGTWIAVRQAPIGVVTVEERIIQI